MLDINSIIHNHLFADYLCSSVHVQSSTSEGRRTTVAKFWAGGWWMQLQEIPKLWLQQSTPWRSDNSIGRVHITYIKAKATAIERILYMKWCELRQFLLPFYFRCMYRNTAQRTQKLEFQELGELPWESMNPDQGGQSSLRKIESQDISGQCNQWEDLN